MHCGAAAIASCFLFAGANLAKRLLTTSFEFLPSRPVIAMLDCDCGSIFSLRAAAQFTQAQFHCGKPPPASAAEDMDPNQPNLAS